MSVSTWDAFHGSPISTPRSRQRRRQPAQANRAAAAPIVAAPPAARPPAKLREHAGIIGLAVAVAVLHTVVASSWDASSPLQPAKPQVVVELVKPTEPEPPKPEKQPEPPKAQKIPKPQSAKPIPRMASQPQPAPAPAPVPKVEAAAPNTAPAVTVPPAPPVQAPEPQETVTQATAYAAYLHNPPPSYPPQAQRLGLEGKVILRVRVLASGKAASVELQTSSGRKMLDEAAIAAVQGWTFAPARRGQMPIDGWATVPVEFKLERS